MHTVNTVSGPLSVKEMGRTLVHEHVHSGMPGYEFDITAPKFIRAEAVAEAVDRLQELADFGCRTIIDPCAMDLGRDAEFVAEVSQRSGTNIIIATGAYTERDGKPSTFRLMPDEVIVDLFVRELTEGIGDTGIKAGVIKIATGDDPTNAYEARMLSLATQAALITGVPLISHTDMARHGHHQIDIVERNCGCARSMVVGHSGDRDDFEYQRSLADRGAFVGLDRFGFEAILPDEIRVRNLIQLIEAGYSDKVLLSHDHCLVMRNNPAIMAEIAPNISLTWIFEYVLPRLRASGVSEACIDRILIDNPSGLFVNAASQLRQGRSSEAVSI